MAKSRALAAVLIAAAIAAQSGVYAAGNGVPVDIAVSEAQLQTGDNVLVSISLPSDTGANGAEVSISYPQEMLSVDKITEGDIIEGAYISSVKQESGELRAVAIWEDTINGGGSILSVLFTAESEGSADITVEGRCTYTDLSSEIFSENVNVEIVRPYESFAEDELMTEEVTSAADLADTESESSSDAELKEGITTAEQPSDLAGEHSAVFSDVAGHWAEREIYRLVTTGVIDGFEDNTFRPDKVVTRAQFIKMLVSALELDTGTSARIFDDVDRSAWYTPYVTAAYSAGIAIGDGAYFYPESEITREEMALMSARACGLSSDNAAEFSDSGDISPWAVEAVSALAEKGIIEGFEDGTFRPKLSASRAQSAVILLRLIDQFI